MKTKNSTAYVYSKAFEEEIIGKNTEQIEILLDFRVESKSEEEYVYIISQNFFGIFKKRLHIYFYNGLVRDFFIG